MGNSKCWNVSAISGCNNIFYPGNYFFSCFLILFISSCFFLKTIFNASSGSIGIHNFGFEKVVDVVTTGYGTNIPTFRIAQGLTNIYSNIEKLIEESKDVIYIVTNVKDISKMYHTNIPEKVKICEKNGGEVRLLVELEDDKMISFVERFGATETKIGKLPSKGRIIVSKGNQMIMSDATVRGPMHQNEESDFALCTNSFEMANNIFSLCTFLWTAASPLPQKN